MTKGRAASTRDCLQEGHIKIAVAVLCVGRTRVCIMYLHFFPRVINVQLTCKNLWSNMKSECYELWCYMNKISHSIRFFATLNIHTYSAVNLLLPQWSKFNTYICIIWRIILCQGWMLHSSVIIKLYASAPH